jgi:tRNA threonylcarbamoyl adenosine modification protein (Sua5/YciO/YrdC/YwlC family)
VSAVFRGDDPGERAAGLTRAAAAVRRGELVVVPTDSAYGVGCDAFSASAVRALRAAKGRGPDLSAPVLIGALRTWDGIATGLTPEARLLAQGWWPGPLTLVCRAQPSLTWDLGSGANVAVRMPLHPLTLELLRATGPMAVVAANRAGALPPATCDDAQRQLGAAVSTYLDGGACGDLTPSTAVDVTGPRPVLVRVGAVSIEALRSVAPDLVVPAGLG